MASDEEKDTLYCICREPYNENEFMIECEICKDWFHGSCVGVLEHQAADIEIYHCPNCQVKHGPLVLKQRRNNHRHDYSDSGSAKAVQTGTVVFIKELKSRAFPSADELPILRMRGSALTKEYTDEHGFDVPILVDRKDGLGLVVPPPSFSIQDVEDHVGSMREIDVIDVARQEDYKMLMREWTEYYSSPNRHKIFNVISLEFSNTRLSELVVVPTVVREISWVVNGVWPDTLPDDCTYSRPEVQKYCLMGVRDSFTDFHVDFGGTSVWYHVLRGEKVFYLIEPTNANLSMYETWLNASNQSEMFFGDQVDKCYKCVVKQGQTMFIPTGWIHAVFTPIDTLVFGGNFVHSYNIPLQLECYAIEKRVKTPEKYLFPSYETLNWYGAKFILDSLKEYLEEGKRPPKYIFEGAKALVFHLRSWSQRKDFVKSARHDVPVCIQYGRLLKDLGKEVKTCEELMKVSVASKASSEKKRKKKKKVATRQMESIDFLHKHTQDKLLQMEMEQKKNIYNFEDDDEDDKDQLAQMRLPKAGAFTDSSGPDSPEKLPSKRSLTLKVSNGKIVSEKKAKKGQFQPFFESDGGGSDSDGLIVDENPSKARRRKEDKSKQPKLKLKLSIQNKPSTETSSNIKPETSPPARNLPRHRQSNPGKLKTTKLEPKLETTKLEPKLETTKLEPKLETTKLEPLKSEPVQSDPIPSGAIPSGSLLSQLPSLKQQKQSMPPISTLLPPRSHFPTRTSDLSSTSSVKVKSESSVVKSNLTLSDIINQAALSTGPSTLGKLEDVNSNKSNGDKSDSDKSNSDKSTLAQALRRNIPTIRGGLNGSISDILEASGYGTETAFTVDDDGERAPSPSMQEAIQGMLSMSRGGLNSMQLFSKAEGRRQAHKRSALAAVEDEEEHLSKYYQDDEYVYPTLEMDEEEQEQVLKAHGKPGKDETWNPKARVNFAVAMGERTHREGTRKEAIKNSLEASAAKIANAPKMKRPYKKKLKLDMDAQPGTSASCLSPTHSGSAFRPGLKFDSAMGDSSLKSKKPKKGQATAKQRLGKILKIHKMGMY